MKKGYRQIQMKYKIYKTRKLAKKKTTNLNDKLFEKKKKNSKTGK